MSGSEGSAAHMAKVLSISSQVVCGHVGNSASVFVLQRMGHEVFAAPTILLSNRPGYKAIAGEHAAPGMIEAMLDAASRNGFLDRIDAILTGYMPTPAHAELCRAWIERITLKNPGAIYLCDPIIGDEHSGVYVKDAAARAIRDCLVPLAGILTPNAFELGWLTGRAIRDPESAVSAARALDRPAVVVTSAPASAQGMLANLCVEGAAVAATQSPKRTIEAHGTGDFFSSIFLAHRLNGFTGAAALRAAAAAIDAVLERSAGKAELALVETQDFWASKAPELAPLAPL
jgi:pyridoxine kinase